MRYNNKYILVLFAINIFMAYIHYVTHIACVCILYIKDKHCIYKYEGGLVSQLLYNIHHCFYQLPSFNRLLSNFYFN